MKQWILMAFVFVGVGFFSCSIDGVKGNGKITNQERTAADFNCVVLNGIGDVNIHFSDTYKVVVITDSNIQDFVTINVNNNVLYIGETDGNIDATKLEIDVYMSALKEINNKGVGDIRVDDEKIDNLKISLSGVGNIDAQNYEARDINVVNSGVGDIKIWATENLNGRLSGVGNIFYKGSPRESISVNGLGKVEKI